jgi:hypothetical protein
MGAWIFLGLVTIPQLFIVLLLGLQVYVRYRLEQRFEQQTAVHLVVEERDLVWVKPGREILVKGEMFDIKSIRYEGGKAYITGIFDHEETEIMHLLKGQANPLKNDQTLVQLSAWLLQFVATGGHLIFKFIQDEVRDFLLFLLMPYKSPYLSLLVPPPQE